jgi:hypothetical protein
LSLRLRVVNTNQSVAAMFWDLDVFLKCERVKVDIEQGGRTGVSRSYETAPVRP